MKVKVFTQFKNLLLYTLFVYILNDLLIKVYLRFSTIHYYFLLLNLQTVVCCLFRFCMDKVYTIVYTKATICISISCHVCVCVFLFKCTRSYGYLALDYVVATVRGPVGGFAKEIHLCPFDSIHK